MAKNNSQNLYEFIVVYMILGMNQADAIVREFGYPGWPFITHPFGGPATIDSLIRQGPCLVLPLCARAILGEDCGSLLGSPGLRSGALESSLCKMGWVYSLPSLCPPLFLPFFPPFSLSVRRGHYPMFDFSSVTVIIVHKYIHITHPESTP